MRKLPFAIFCFSLIGCQNSETSDQLRFSEFEKICHDEATEFVTEGAADGAVTLTQDYEYSMHGPGKADRAVYDQEYDPDSLLQTLLTEPNKLPMIRYRYHLQPCKSYFYYIDATSRENSKPIYQCVQAKVWDSETDHLRYAITYEYGALSESDIRPFTFRLVDGITGRIIAEQKSFQLLLGGMASQKNKSFTGFGVAQRAKTCRLTPPDIFIKKAFDKKCITTQSR
jgi:hypothetical protein